MTVTAAPPVVVRQHGRLGRITLNRPDSVNALSREMVGLMTTALERWEHDDSVLSVIVDGAGDRGLCAGGDLRADETDPADFLRDEYHLNAMIAEYPKPYIAWMDGITMGGGVGISAHGSLRVVTERSQVAMPETRIALCPDVGGTYLLARAPGLIGLHLGLTSSRMTGADAIAAGFADILLPAAARESLAASLAAGEEPLVAATALSVDPGPSTLAAERDWIDHCYAADALPEVLARLRERGPAAAAAADTIESFSPTAVSVAFEAIRRAADLSLRDCLSMEYVIMRELATRDDVGEGIRATLHDRSHTPQWSEQTLAEVDLEAIDQLIARASTARLW